MKALEKKEDEAMEEEKKRKKKGSSPDNPSKLKKTNSVNIPDAVLDDLNFLFHLPATSEAEPESPGGCDGSHSKEEKILYHVTPEGKFQWVYFLLL